jgi:NodT family efflux transporter outer membrane factor (OMF) lipoprotein
MKRNIIYVIAPLLFFGGCANLVAPKSRALADINNTIDIPKNYSTKISSKNIDDNWIKSFRDPTLNSLVKEALKNNQNLKVAATRVQRAIALTDLSQSELQPTIGASAFYRDNNSEGANEISFGGASVSWEPDIWGRVANSVASQEEKYRATLADYKYTQQSLAANTAKAWFLLNANSEIYEFTKEIVKLQEKGLKILDAREKIGQGNKRDVHISNALVASAKEKAQAALTAKQRAQRALEVLLGRYPSAKLKAKKLYALPPSIPASLPAKLLERRPDLIAAQSRVAAAFYQKESAKLLHMPNIRLKLGVGPNSINDAITSLSSGIFAPLYTGGAIEAQIAVATADQKSAVASYANRALKAFQEVENALSAEKILRKRYEYLKTTEKEYNIAYKMTVERYRIGESSVLDIIIVQGQWIAAEIARVQVAKKLLINRINLHLALGGSFE